MTVDRSVAPAVAALDLSSVIAELTAKEKWSAEKAEHVEGEYRWFLSLHVYYPNELFVPLSQDLDTFWHRHIVDTRKYAQDCQIVFGYFLHHNPHFWKDTVAYDQAHERTIQLFATEVFPPRDYGEGRVQCA
jgi:hypothetical protein